MGKISLTIALVLTFLAGQSQMADVPSKQLQTFQINAYRYPAPTLHNLMWLALVPEQSFISELQLFDFGNFDVDHLNRPVFSSGFDLPSAKYSIIKNDEGMVQINWIMTESRIERLHPIDKLVKELALYPSQQENPNTVSYKIRHSKWYLYIEIKREFGEETITMWASTDPK